ncbi:MAG TPA: hypothetical protein VN672_02655 [Solirubrobacteraceae bacterium]|nr:hypothetical protein [Solirubrobacteraceae bacterium]
MGKLSPRSFLKTLFGAPNAIAAVSGPAEAPAIEGSSRRMFLEGTAGAVTGAAVILATPKVASMLDAASQGSPSSEPKGVVTQPSGPAAREPVTAYVRNVERNEVTVMSGTREVTYRDPVLVKRLLDAAH